ncbi:MAG TPA: lysyl oxidase family protein [Actinomycetota bacterium]|nr:lysyl oxidase family protein [Actinomycetota bacterium]
MGRAKGTKSGLLVAGLAAALVGTSPGAGWSATTTTTAVPSSATVLAGSIASGTAANLSTDDGSAYEVNSTARSSFKTQWQGSFTDVPNEITSLTVSYQGWNSRSCSQVLLIRKWSSGSWVKLDAQRVGPTEVLVTVAPTDSPSRYVSGATGPGDVSLRVKCSTTAGRFLSSADLLNLTYDQEVLIDELPNVVPLKPFDLRVGLQDDGTGPALRLSVSTANRGSYPLDVLAVPGDGGGSSDAYQCVVWSTPRECQQRRAVGEFVFHAAHNHYHFEDFALYELRRLAVDGGPDLSPEGLVAPGVKASFCLLDYESDGPPPDPAYEDPYYVRCSGSDGDGIQGLSPAWRDTYRSGLAGQQIPIDGVADGDYAVVITADPTDRLWESENGDNVSFERIHLAGGSVSLLP